MSRRGASRRKCPNLSTMLRSSLLGTAALALLMGCAPATTVAEAPATTVAEAPATPSATTTTLAATDSTAEAATTEAATTEAATTEASAKPSKAAVSSTEAESAETTTDSAAVAQADAATQDPEPSAETHAEWGPLYDVISIYDGDTIAVRIDGVRERVRIIGINAPEMARSGQAAECHAQESTSRVQSLLQGGKVHLLPDPSQADRDRYDRLLRHVVMDGGGHLALLLVQEGLAEERQYAAPYQWQGDLQTAESQARAAGLGLWSACAAPVQAAPVAPVAPAPAPSQPAAPAQPAPPVTPPAADPATCNIKGNISSSGERIYHVPGQRHYDQTVISPEKGERWFCTEQEARDAGWRKAKV